LLAKIRELEKAGHQLERQTVVTKKKDQTRNKKSKKKRWNEDETELSRRITCSLAAKQVDPVSRANKANAAQP
jgi:hypothetical protein